MKHVSRCLAGAVMLIWVLTPPAAADETNKSGGDVVFGEFVGSSPCGLSIREMLGIPPRADAELIEWRLALYQDPKTKAPAQYKLHCEFGPTKAGKPGLGKTAGTVNREGRWTIGKGTKSSSRAVVYELQGALSLARIDDNVLHVLNGDRSLMNGNGGWSYTLNRAPVAEKPVDPKLAATAPDMSYPIAAASTGPSVFAVFEGRTPYQGIARELKIESPPGANKAKWRITLYQDARSDEPTKYKVEGTLFRKGAREGTWSIVRGTPEDPQADVCRLSPANDQSAIWLLKGDDNVLFFLNAKRMPMVGHAEFSYTLNRKDDASLAGAAPSAAGR